MAKTEALQKHTLNLRSGDVEKLRDFFPDIPASNLIRTIVSRYVDALEGDANTPEVSINL